MPSSTPTPRAPQRRSRSPKLAELRVRPAGPKVPSARVATMGAVVATVAVLVAAPWCPAGRAAATVTASSPTTSTAPTAVPTTAAQPGTPTSWTRYHGDAQGSGDVSAAIDLGGAHRVFTSPTLAGQLYGEPLVDGSDIYVATTADQVYALSATTGRVQWSTRVGTPVPSSALPCGDISPTVGIIGTPVIDPARRELFAVADQVVNGVAAHWLVGLSLDTGSLLLHQDVDPPGAAPTALLQRTGLTLDGGRIVFGFGGNYGDCAAYHGWVESVPETGGAPDRFEVDPADGDRQGAVWMGGAAPVLDAAGDLWVAAGNGSVTSASQPYDDSDSVLELSPSLQLLAYYAPSTWASDNGSDKDLGSSAPAVLPDGLVVQAGKSQTAYLLQGSHLGGINGQLTQLGSICGGDVDGGDAFSPTGTGEVVYLPCQTGIVDLTVQTSPPAIHVRWRSSSGSSGPPIVADGLIWTISQRGTLYGLSPETGAPVQTLAVGTEANHFPTPAVADGLLLAPAASQVVAFAGSTTPLTAPTTAPTTSTTTRAPASTSTTLHPTSTHRSGKHQGPLAVALSVLGIALLAVVLAVVLLRVRRPQDRR